MDFVITLRLPRQVGQETTYTDLSRHLLAVAVKIERGHYAGREMPSQGVLVDWQLKGWQPWGDEASND